MRPIDARDTRKDVLEKSALMIDSPSATIVPLPTELRYGVSCFTSRAEVRPGLLDPGEVVPEAAQVVDDVGAVTEETREELDVGHARDRPVDPVVEAVQADRPCPA